jgi:hypothetical protein
MLLLCILSLSLGDASYQLVYLYSDLGCSSTTSVPSGQITTACPTSQACTQGNGHSYEVKACASATSLTAFLSYTAYTDTVIFGVFPDSSCSTASQTEWYALPASSTFSSSQGTFVTTTDTSSSPPTCTLIYANASLSSTSGCTKLPSGTSYSLLICQSPASSTSPPTSTSSTSSPTWSGTYSIQPGCSQSSCCCLSGSAVVTQSGTSLSIVSPVAGQCGTTTSITATATLSSFSSTTASFTLLGQSFIATRSGDSVIVDNISAPSCSGTAICSGGACLVSPPPPNPAPVSTSSSPQHAVATVAASLLLFSACVLLLSS